MRIAVFATTELGGAVELIGRIRRAHPQACLVAFVRDDHRDELAPVLVGCEMRRDKPAGGRVRFLRELRRQRFDLAVVAWHGGERLQPLRFAALFCGARRLLAVDERGHEREVRWYAPRTWGGHALRRLARMRAVTALRGLAALYRATIGLAVAALRLLPTTLLLWFGGALRPRR